MSTADLQQARMRIERALHPFRQRAILVGLIAAIAIGLLVIISTLLIGMWVDLTVPMSVGLRRCVVPLAAIAAISFIVSLMRRMKQNTNESAMAERVDEFSDSGGRVMTGYDLVCDLSNEAAPLSQGLALMAAEQAEDVCVNIDEETAIPTDNARYWWKVVGATALGLCLFAFFVPRLAWTQVQRILIPMETQLPYSSTTIEVQPGDTEVLFGNDLEVEAKVVGPLVEDLELVFEYDEESTETLPMLAESDRNWRTFVTRVTKPARYHVRGGTARSHWHELKVKMTPQINSVTCKITPPSYTRRGVYEGPIPQDGISGLAGTEVILRATSNRPLSAGKLVLKIRDQQTVTMKPIADSELNAVQGKFTLSQPGEFNVSVIDVDEIESTDSVSSVIRILPDHSPVVRLLQPKPISLATPDVNLPIVVAAEDDYGISRVELFRGLNGSSPIGKRITLESVESDQRIGTSLPLPTYGLKPGDEITLFARVEDNDPSGAKGAESPIATVRIISKEQLAEITMAKQGMNAILNKQRQVQRMLADLKEKMQAAADAQNAAQKAADKAQAAAEKAAADSSPESKNAAESAAKAAQQAQRAAAKAMQEATEATRKSAESMQNLASHQLPVDVDEGLSEKMQELADKLSKAAERLAELTEKMNSGQPLSESEEQEVEDLRKQFSAAKEEHQQQSMQPTEKLAKTFPLAADEKRFAQLARQQRNLAQRLNALETANQSDPATQRRADELRREQQQLQVALSQVLEDIESHAKQLPKDNPEFDKLRKTAQEFVKQVRASQADPTMTSAQEELLNEDSQKAAQQAANAANILEGFLSQCQSMGNSACKNCQASFNPSAGCPNLGNSIQQMLNRMGLGEGQSPGMKPGMGPGMAPGGGYSMPQNTAENIGLYGGLPTEMATPRSGNGEKSDGGIASYSEGGSASATGGGEMTAEGSTRGDATATVPSVYKEQVAEYFRKIAEELGDL